MIWRSFQASPAKSGTHLELQLPRYVCISYRENLSSFIKEDKMLIIFLPKNA